MASRTIIRQSLDGLQQSIRSAGHGVMLLSSNDTSWLIKMRSMAFFSKSKSKAEIKEEKSILAKTQTLMKLQDKSKERFMEFVDSFKVGNPNLRGHVEFIYACLKHVEDFGLTKDLDTYKKLLDTFPKGPMVAKSFLQAEFFHFPRQQQCAIDVLQKMEDHGVVPDVEIQQILLNTFGYRAFAYRKFARMMYWMPKFKNASPWPLPKPVPDDTFELAMLAMKRINTVDLQSKISHYQTSDRFDAIDHTWILSAQCPTQKKLIEKLPTDKPIYVEGAFRVWLRNVSIAYFVLRADNDNKARVREDYDDVSNIKCKHVEEEKSVIVRPSVHEQEDGIILATCASGTSSRDSLLSWINFLQMENSRLKEIPVLFTLRAPSTAIVPVNSSGLPSEDTPENDETTEPITLTNESP